MYITCFTARGIHEYVVKISIPIKDLQYIFFSFSFCFVIIVDKLTFNTGSF